MSKLNRADAKQRHEIEKELREIEKLKEKHDLYKDLGGQEAMKELKALTKLNNDLKKLDAKGEIDIEIEKAKGNNKVGDIKADGRTSRFRKATQAISGFVKGFGDKTKDDITSADNAAKLAKKQLAKAKTVAAKKVWENATKRLAEIMKSHEYTEEQKTKIAEAVIQESLRQAEKAK